MGIPGLPRAQQPMRATYINHLSTAIRTFMQPLAAIIAAALAATLAVGLGVSAYRSPPAVNGHAKELQDLNFVPRNLDFVLRNGATAEKHQIETMAGGVAVLDFDNDGHPDLFFTNGARLPGLDKSDPTYWNRLYRNRGDGTFEDVTAKAGLQGAGFCIGVAVGDFDNDGYPDLFVAGVRQNFLYHNLGNGRFEDVTESSGLAQPQEPRWAVGGGWLDYDNDGRLDLFIVNYVHWNPAKEPACGDVSGNVRTYCHPRFYQGQANRLFHNEGNGRFGDVSDSSGIGTHIGKGMAVAFADMDNDGWTDIVVTNDTERNFLFRNRGNGTFEELSEAAGVAYNNDGLALSSMGVDFRDANNDGRPDIFITTVINETFPLFINNGGKFFNEVTDQLHIGRSTRLLTGWGAGIYDFDNDGRKDLFVATGQVSENAELFSDHHAKQRCLFLRQTARGIFSPEQFGPEGLFRGAAFADFDGDGRVDVVTTRLDGSAMLLANRSARQNHWLELRLIGTRSNRDAMGAKLHLFASSGQQWNHVTTAVGYASASDRVVHFGLGAATLVTRLEISWPSGTRQTLENLTADRLLVVTEPSQAGAAPLHPAAAGARPAATR